MEGMTSNSQLFLKTKLQTRSLESSVSRCKQDSVIVEAHTKTCSSLQK